jgi:purine nucleoside phosphorylase
VTTAVILGSSFSRAELAGVSLTPERVPTRFGEVTLHRRADGAVVLFRHGVPHRYLPHQIPYRAHAAALATVGCKALLATSSVGVVDASVPLFRPLLVSDLFMIDNRLPDGSTCTMFTERSDDGAHLLVEDGLFSTALNRQLEQLAGAALPRVVFAYVGGPRTKTAAENRWLATTGAQVNSMTLGPEVVLANELGIPTAALVVGHKYSLPRAPGAAGAPIDVGASLDLAQTATATLVAAFLDARPVVEFGNRLYHFVEGGR